MKTLRSYFLLLTAALAYCTITLAQSPQLINYQAVARNASGQTLINQAVSVRLSVRQTTAGGTIQYQETHNLTTTTQGLINLQIGGGNPNLDSFADITWTDGQPKFLQTELDPDGPLGAQTYINLGAQQLVSVPYALYSEEARWVKVSGDNMRVGETNYNLGGDKNVAIGKQALSTNTTASQNSALGFNALLNNNGFGNTAVGSQALLLNGAGAANCAVGYNALYGNMTGSDNTAVGSNSMYSNSSGGLNSAFGQNSLYNNISGSSNTAFGATALFLNTGSNNAAGGYGALFNNTTGSHNTAFGYFADVATNNLNYATAIGAFATVGASNSLVLGGTGITAVKVGIGLTTPTADIHVKQTGNTFTRGIRTEFFNSANNWRTYIDGALDYNFDYNDVLKAYILDDTGAYTVASDLRLKKDISPIAEVLPKIMQLQPKTYRYNDNTPNAPLSYGFIAQEVEPIFPDFVNTKAETGMKAIAYDNFAVIAIQAIKEQQQMMEQLQQKTSEIDALKAELQLIKALLMQNK